MIATGHLASLDLSGRGVVMVGTYNDDEAGSPWTAALFVDQLATPAQQEALADIFLGRAGGTPAHNYAGAIATVTGVSPARIELDHRRRQWRPH